MSDEPQATGDEQVDAIVNGLTSVQQELAARVQDLAGPDGSPPVDLDDVLKMLTDAQRNLADRLAALD